MNIIDLVDSDEESSINVRNHNSTTSNNRNTNSNIGHTIIYGNREVIDLVSDDDEPISNALRNNSSNLNNSNISVTENQEPAFKKRRLSIKGIEIKIEHEPKCFGEANQGDDVVEVHGESNTNDNDIEIVSKPMNNVNNTKINNIDDDEDIVCVGGNMNVASDMPHQREACTVFRFLFAPQEPNCSSTSSKYIAYLKAAKEQSSNNLKYCQMCYCYICEVKSSECIEWEQHCNATCNDYRCKLERNARNMKILQLLTPKTKAKFYSKFKIILTTPSLSSTSSSDINNFDHYLFDSDDDDNDSDQSNKIKKSGNLSDLVFLISCVKDFLERSKYLKLKNTKESIIKANDYYLQSSLILIRIVANNFNDYSMGQTPNYKIWIDWLFHICSTHKLRIIVLEEIKLHLSRSYRYSTGPYRSIFNLFEMGEITFNNIINPSQISQSNVIVHSYIIDLAEPLLLSLLETFTENNYDFVVQNIFKTIPNRCLGLILLYLNKGTLKDSIMAMEFLTKAEVSRSWILDKKKEFEILSIQKVIYFLIAAISITIESFSSITTNMNGNSPTKKHDNLIDILFNILFRELFSKTAQCSIGISYLYSNIQIYFDQDNTLYSIENVKNWIENEISTPDKIETCSIYLYISYCHWKLLNLPSSMTLLHRDISTIIITPAVFWNLTPYTLLLLANAFCCYFKHPNQIHTSSISNSINNNNQLHMNIPNKVSIKLQQNELTEYSYLNLNVLLGCQIISRIFDYEDSQNKSLKNDFFNYIDSRIISIWSESPFIYKKTIDCSYNMNCLEVLQVSSCQEQNISSNNINTPLKHPKHVLKSFWKEFLENDSNEQQEVLLPIVNICNTNNSRTIEYCGKHINYDELIKKLILSNNEDGLSLLCLGHRLNISDLIYILDHCMISIPKINSNNNIPIDEYQGNNWIKFLNLNFNQLSIIWKGFILNSYMIFNACHIFWCDKFYSFCTKFYNLLEPYHIEGIDINVSQSLTIIKDNSNSVKDQLVYLDHILKSLYYFTNMHITYQRNEDIDCQESITQFKQHVLRNENNLSIETMKLVCKSYLLEDGMMNIKYTTWNTFWKKLLKYITFDQNYSFFKPTDKVDSFAVAVVLEDWVYLENILNNAEHENDCIDALAEIKYSTFICTRALNDVFDGIHILQSFITNLTKSNDILSFLSDKCMEQSDSFLAYLVKQLDLGLIMSGALDMYPYFAYILQLKFNELSNDISKSIWLQDRRNEINRRYDDFVNNISLSTPNGDYKNALYCCVYMKRHDHARFLLSMGINELLCLTTTTTASTVSSSNNVLIENNLQRNVVLQDMLRFSSDIFEFVDIAEMILTHLSDLYLYSNGVSMMESIYQEFYSSLNKDNNYPLNVTNIINLLHFYHKFDEESFINLWEGIKSTGSGILNDIESKKVMLFQWIQNLEEVNERFNMITILCIRYYICNESEFMFYLLKQINMNNNPHLESIVITLIKLILPNQKINYQIIMIIISTLFKLKKLSPTVLQHIKLCSIFDTDELSDLNSNCISASDHANITNDIFTVESNKWITIENTKIILRFIKYGVEMNSNDKDSMIELFKNIYFEESLQDILELLVLPEYQALTINILLQTCYQIIDKNNSNIDYFKVFTNYIDKLIQNINTDKDNVFIETISNILSAIQASISKFTNISFFDILNPNSFINQIANIFLLIRNTYINFMEINSKLLENEIIEKYIKLPIAIDLQLKTLMENMASLPNLKEYEQIITSYLDIYLDTSLIKCENFYKICLINNKSIINSDSQLFYDVFMKIIKKSTNCLLSLHIIKNLLTYIERQEGKTLLLNLKKHDYSIETIILQCINNPTFYYSTIKNEHNELVKYGFLWIPTNDGYYTFDYCMVQLYQLLEKYDKKIIELGNLLVEPILRRINYGKISYKLTNTLNIESIESSLSMQKWIDLTILNNNTTSHQNIKILSNQSYFKDIFQYFNTKCNGSLSYIYNLSQLFGRFSYIEFIDKQHILQGLKNHSIYFINIMMRIVLKHIINHSIECEDIAKILILQIHFPDNRYDYFFNTSQKQLIISMVKEYTSSYLIFRNSSYLHTSNNYRSSIIPLKSFRDFPELLYLFTNDYKNKGSMYCNGFSSMDASSELIQLWINVITNYNMLANIIYEISINYFNAMIQELHHFSVRAARRNLFEEVITKFKELFDLYHRHHTNFMKNIEKIVKDAKILLKNKPALVKILKLL